MSRTITITDTSTPSSGETITDRAYRLLAADGTTELSAADPPYAGVTDALVHVELTVTQSDAQTDTVTLAIPGRVTDLAATNDAAPVLTWSDVGGETSYEIHRGASGFTPDVAGHSTRVGTAAAGAETFTDTGVSGNGSTVVGYRVVALTAAGYTIGNEATSTPATSGVTLNTPTTALSSTSSTTLVINHTVPAGADFLQVDVSHIANSVQGITSVVSDVDGALTSQGAAVAVNATGLGHGVFTHAAPTPGAHAITITFSAAVTKKVAMAVSVSGASAVVGTANKLEAGTDTSPTVTIASATGRLVVAGIGVMDSTQTLTCAETQISDVSAASGATGIRQTVYTKAGAASVTVSASLSGVPDDWATSAVSYTP